MSHPLACAAAFPTTSGTKDLLFAAGGVQQFSDYYTSVDTVEVYDLNDDAWQPYPSLIHARMGATAVAVRHRLFVLGGTALADEGAIVAPEDLVSAVEVYDIRTGQWAIAPGEHSHFIPRTAMAAVYAVLPSAGDCILTVGGRGTHTSVEVCALRAH